MKKREWILILVWAGLVLFSRALKFNLPIGGQSATFCLFVVLLPMIVYFFPSKLYLGAGLWFLTHLLHPLPLTVGIPTLLAALSWKVSHKKDLFNSSLHLFFPLMAIALFILSPNGKEAWLYTLYWLIPVLCCFGRNNLFKRSLQSTFTAHAAGSVMWVYLTPLSSQQWLALIPVVAIERLIATFFAILAIKAFSQILTVKRSADFTCLKEGMFSS